MASCPPLSLTPLPFPPHPSHPRLSVLCALCEPLSLLITITIQPPHPKLGKYNSIFLCALGNLYNSILNLNETVKNTLKNSAKERQYCRTEKNKLHVSLFVFHLVSVIFAGFSGGYSKTVTADQDFVVFLPEDTRHQLRLSGSCHYRCAGMMWCSVL